MPSDNEHEHENHGSNNSSGNSSNNSSGNSSGNSSNNSSNNSSGNSSNNSSNNSSGNSSHDASCNPTDLTPPIVPVITTHLKDQTIVEPSLVIQNREGLTASGYHVAYTTFDTTDPASYVQVTERLLEDVGSYDDVLDSNNENSQLLLQIKDYAGKIQCSDFHGKGTIDDYTSLFTAASRIANETKSITLDVDIDGFNEFSQAADDLSALFTSFIVKLQNVNIINDSDFLRAIVIALRKIYNLSEVFGRFKETIFSTTTIQFPKSSHETKMVLEGVMDEIRCAMQYIGHFVAPDANVGSPVDADLSLEEKNIISEAVATIDNWNVICEHGISIAMENNPDVVYITQASNELKQTTNDIKRATSILRSKFASFHLC